MEQIDLYSALNLMMAYLDPGSGSIFIQLLISIFIGVGFYIRAKFGKIKNIFGKKSEESEEDHIEDDIDV